MMRKTGRWAARIGPLALVVLWATMPSTGQAQSPSYGTQNGEWQTYGGDLKSTKSRGDSRRTPSDPGLNSSCRRHR